MGLSTSKRDLRSARDDRHLATGSARFCGVQLPVKCLDGVYKTSTDVALTLDVIKDRRRWQSTLERFSSYDFCHTFDFHELSQKNGEGEPCLFVVYDRGGESVFCWPMLQRDIDSTPWCDFTSVYGYGGPLIKDEDAVLSSYELILQELRELGAVTLFSRMHPLFVNQSGELTARGEQAGNVVIINTDLQHETIPTYRKDHRRGIRKAVNEGVEVFFDLECKNIDRFIDIYYEAMRELGASNYYYFTRSYFKDIVAAKDFETVLSFARLDGKDIAAGMALVTNDFMQSYLGGTVPKYKRLAPMKLINEREHAFAIENKIRHIILGGGVGGASDPVYKFKTGFSQSTMPFYIYKKIINHEIYQELCDEKGVDSNVDGYFPAYRRP